jgi:DNA-binding CsgD family transcriptional regulator
VGNLRTFPSPAKSAVAPSLTAREAEVVSLAYLTNAEIAKILSTSSHTIRAHFRAVAIKFGTETRTQAYIVWQQQMGKAA